MAVAAALTTRPEEEMILRHNLLHLILLLILTTAACREGVAEPTPTPDPRLILQQAADTMQALESARFEVTRSDGPIYLLLFDQEVLFTHASGEYAAPESMQGVIRGQVSNLDIEVNTIAIGFEQWLRNPLTRRWVQMPPEGLFRWGFSPYIFFDPVLGWQMLVREDIRDLSAPEMVEVDGRSLYHIRGTMAGRRVQVITFGLVGDEPTDISFWIDPQTLHVVRMQFSTASEEDEPSVWLLTFSNFDEPVTIEPPPGN
jgi:hypothetical protein